MPSAINTSTALLRYFPKRGRIVRHHFRNLDDASGRACVLGTLRRGSSDPPRFRPLPFLLAILHHLPAVLAECSDGTVSPASDSPHLRSRACGVRPACRRANGAWPARARRPSAEKAWRRRSVGGDCRCPRHGNTWQARREEALDQKLSISGAAGPHNDYRYTRDWTQVRCALGVPGQARSLLESSDHTAPCRGRCVSRMVHPVDPLPRPSAPAPKRTAAASERCRVPLMRRCR